MNEPCPLCGHFMHEHDPEVGCQVEWLYTAEGTALRDGCPCPMTLAAVHRRGYVDDQGVPVV